MSPDTSLNAARLIRDLINVLPLELNDIDSEGRTVYGFGGAAPFLITALGQNSIQLSAEVGPAPREAATLQRLVEAGFLGAETGASHFAISQRSGAVILTETVDLHGLTMEMVQRRLVDLTVSADYWKDWFASASAPNDQAFPPENELIFRL